MYFRQDRVIATCGATRKFPATTLESRLPHAITKELRQGEVPSLGSNLPELRPLPDSHTVVLRGEAQGRHETSLQIHEHRLLRIANFCGCS